MRTVFKKKPQDLLDVAGSGAISSRSGKCPLPWWQRIGLLGFLFFLVKGLLWLIVPGAIVLWRSLRGE